MGLSDATILEACRNEAGAAEEFYTDAEARFWFNQGAARLGRFVPQSDTLSWNEGDTEVALPSDFHEISKLDYDQYVTPQPFRVFGNQLIVDCATGASADGTARLYYWGEPTELLEDGTSVLSNAECYAVIPFVIHRLYRRLCGNRVFYQRYSTLLGANAVSVGDLQAESDRLLQDFIDARDDLPLQDVPAGW